MVTIASLKNYYMVRVLYGVVFLVPTPACPPHTLRRISGAKQIAFPSLSPLTGIYGLTFAVVIGFFLPSISLGNSCSSRMGFGWGCLLRPFAPGLRMTSFDYFRNGHLTQTKLIRVTPRVFFVTTTWRRQPLISGLSSLELLVALIASPWTDSTRQGAIERETEWQDGRKGVLSDIFCPLLHHVWGPAPHHLQPKGY